MSKHQEVFSAAKFRQDLEQLQHSFEVYRPSAQGHSVMRDPDIVSVMVKTGEPLFSQAEKLSNLNVLRLTHSINDYVLITVYMEELLKLINTLAAT